MCWVKQLLPLWLLVLVSLACNFPIKALPEGLRASETLPSPLPSTPTPWPTPTTTPTPTPLPAARVAEGDHAIFNGDWDSALHAYQAALQTNADEEIQSAALLGIGRTYYLSGNHEIAKDTLLDLISKYPDSPHLPQVYFTLAQTCFAQGLYTEASDAYQRYLDLRPGVIDSYVSELRGDALFAAGDYTSAIVDYQAALQAPRAAKDLSIDIKVAESYARTGDHATAIVGYRDIYNRTSNDYIKAQMDLLMGQAYTELGDLEQANAAYLDTVENFPLSRDSYTALVALVEAGAPVNDLDRGVVDYYARQYAVAVAAFDRYLQSSPDDPGTAIYYKGLAFNGLGEHQAAIEEWDRLIQDYPEHRNWSDAWEQKAFTQWFYLDQYTQAVQTLLDFVAGVPLHPKAGGSLFDAASISERAGRLEQAAELWERMGKEYPSSEQANRALFLAGITRHRVGNYPAALADFQHALSLAGNPGERAAAYFWLGKCQQTLGDSEAARAAWEQAAAQDRSGYYSERARDLLAGRPPFTPPQEYDLSFDAQAERREAEAWIRTVFSLPDDTDLSGPGPLVGDPRFQRGNELWQLGLYSQARLEFEDLRKAVESDPANSYRLANHLIDIGLYRSGIFAARQVLTLAGMDDSETLSAPIYFNHLRFGTYYRDLIIPIAQDYSLHPLFLFSVVRQESLFEGFIRSPAGARGLMQIIPTTGQEVAANAGWPLNFTFEDLYRPLVSLRLGSDYMARQRDFMSGDLYAALAAYNGGPGNAKTWKGMAPGDPDLFLEVIRFGETRDYIRRVYEIFNIYRELYDRTP